MCDFSACENNLMKCKFFWFIFNDFICKILGKITVYADELDNPLTLKNKLKK